MPFTRKAWTSQSSLGDLVAADLVESRMDVIMLVKAAPVLTSGLEETMCVAGARVDGLHPEWVRLHPVPFRDLDSEQRFAKYQRVSVVNLLAAGAGGYASRVAGISLGART